MSPGAARDRHTPPMRTLARALRALPLPLLVLFLIAMPLLQAAGCAQASDQAGWVAFRAYDAAVSPDYAVLVQQEAARRRTAIAATANVDSADRATKLADVDAWQARRLQALDSARRALEEAPSP